MPAPRDEPVENLSLLQKQLILAQVQILELEDVQDELRTEIGQRAKILAELQVLADRALAESREAHITEAAAQQALNASREAQQALQATVESLRQETENMNRGITQLQNALSETNTAVATRAERIATLDRELGQMKSSRSWRWTAPLRSIGRLFR